MTSLDNLLIAHSEALSVGGTGLASFYEHEIRNEIYHRSLSSALDKIYDSGDRDKNEEEYTERELPAMARGMGFTTPEAWEAFRDAQ
jgi:hypothetical protein